RMLEARSLKLDLAALGLLALCVFMGLSLASYDPADSLDAPIYPPPVHSANACGRGGAILADVLVQGLGLGAYYLLASLVVFDAWLLTRRRISLPLLRLAGWLASLAALCTLISLAAPVWATGPAIGPGGYVGAAGRGLLELHFARAGSYVLTIS